MALRGENQRTKMQRGSIISPNCDNPRNCIYVKYGINSMAKLRFCSRDATMADVLAVVGEGGQ